MEFLETEPEEEESENEEEFITTMVDGLEELYRDDIPEFRDIMNAIHDLTGKRSFRALRRHMLSRPSWHEAQTEFLSVLADYLEEPDDPERTQRIDVTELPASQQSEDDAASVTGSGLCGGSLEPRLYDALMVWIRSTFQGVSDRAAAARAANGLESNLIMHPLLRRAMPAMYAALQTIGLHSFDQWAQRIRDAPSYETPIRQLIAALENAQGETDPESEAEENPQAAAHTEAPATAEEDPSHLEGSGRRLCGYARFRHLRQH